MNEEELNRLTEKYYSGSCTDEEERTLREYFRNNIAPEGFEAEKVIFGYYDSAGIIPEPSVDFETRIMDGIESSDRKTGLLKRRKYILPYLSAAAGILILVGSYFFFISRSRSEDTFRDPKVAYAETIKILKDVSIRLNNGTRALEPVAKIDKMKTKSFEEINKSSSLIRKNLKNLDYLGRAFEIAGIPVNKNTNK
jgi:hypothetical protein